MLLLFSLNGGHARIRIEIYIQDVKSALLMHCQDYLGSQFLGGYMAKKKPTAGGKSINSPIAGKQVVQPDYYQQFHCIGSDCEDSCCKAGWRVDIDRATWQLYQACRSETLSPMFRDFVELTTKQEQRHPEKFAYFKLQNGHCPFLQDDMLCKIQGELGADALCDTCATYPRYSNQFGQQREYGLGVSCPEAARIILLHPEPTALVMGDADASLKKREINSFKVTCATKEEPVLNQFRVLIFRILQWREVSLGARMMVLGLLLDEVGRAYNDARGRGVSNIMPMLETYAALFADPAYVETEFRQLPGNLPRKLQYTTGFLADFLISVSPRFKECLTAFAAGLLGGLEDESGGGDPNRLLSRYQQIYDEYYLPYFRDKGYIYENYLVNEALISLFPFTGGGFLHSYRAMVFNLAIIQIMLVGMAGNYKGLIDGQVIQFIQSFARRSVHNHDYIRKLTEAITSKDAPSFVEVMWLLKER